MSRISKVSEVGLRCLAISRVAFFHRSKCPKPVAFPANADACLPFACMVRTRSFKIFLAHNYYTVAGVLASCGQAHIAPAIIGSFVVDVINVIRRGFPRHPFPYQSVCLERGAVQGVGDISIGSDGAYRIPRKFCVPFSPRHVIAEVRQRPAFPAKNASFRSILEALAQIRLIGQTLGSHCILLRRIGGQRRQGPARLCRLVLVA